MVGGNPRRGLADAHLRNLRCQRSHLQDQSRALRLRKRSRETPRPIVSVVEIFDDLAAEFARLESILDALTPEQWLHPSGVPNWSVCDVVLHLAQSEEAVVASATGAAPIDAGDLRGLEVNTVDAIMDVLVRTQRAEPDVVFDRWKHGHRRALTALANADPEVRLAWAAAPLKPAALATTRIAETWAHALDVTEPFGIALPDEDRLRHVAWLGHRSLPYAFSLAGMQAPEVRAELTSADGSTTWVFGSDAAASVISGPLGAFCRVGAQRLAPSESGLKTAGPCGEAALNLLRNYAK